MFSILLTVIASQNPEHIIFRNVFNYNFQKLVIIISRNNGDYNCVKCQQSYLLDMLATNVSICSKIATNVNKFNFLKSQQLCFAEMLTIITYRNHETMVFRNVSNDSFRNVSNNMFGNHMFRNAGVKFQHLSSSKMATNVINYIF